MALTITFNSYELPLQHPFTISRYTVTLQKTMIVSITDGIFTGYGEATVNPYYDSTLQKMAASIEKVKSLFAVLSIQHPKVIWEQLAPILQDDYFALCAIDVAYWDFYSKIKQMPLRDCWSDSNLILPQTSYTIALDTIAMMQQKIIEKPWPIYKIKLGTANDLKIVESLRKITDAVFRIDANGAWLADQAIQYAKVFKGINVEFIEQPLAANDVDGMKKLKQQSVLPILADESCQREEDVAQCAELFNGINIKLMKCGGITPALRMIAMARKHNLKVMAGCMTESTIGISALVQLAPLLDYIDSDGALLLANDIATGVTFDYGKIVYANAFGTGANMTTL